MSHGCPYRWTRSWPSGKNISRVPPAARPHHRDPAGSRIATRHYSPGDRLYFLRNERSLGVKNGSLGTIEDVIGGVLQVKLDTPAETRIAVDTRMYRDLDYGYAATVHKAQGATVDRTYILATPHFDRHATYVALSRHRESVTVFYAASDFGAGRSSDPPALEEAHQRMVASLSRARTQDLVHD